MPTNGKVVGEIDNGIDDLTYLTFSPDGSMLATTNENGTVQLWSVATTKLILTLTVVKDVVIPADPSFSSENLIELAFSPDSKTLATIDSGNSLDNGNSLKIWDVASGNLLSSTAVGNATKYNGTIAFSPDSTTIATYYYNNYLPSDSQKPNITVDVWNIANSHLTHTTSITTTKPKDVIGIYFIKSNKNLMALDSDGTVQYLSVDSTQPPYTQSIMPGDVSTFPFNSASNIIMGVPNFGDDFLIEGAYLNHPGTVFTLRGNHLPQGGNSYQGISSISFSGDGQKLAALGTDGLVEIYDLATKKQLINFLITPDLVQSSKLLDGGKSIALVYCDQIKIWNISSHKFTNTLPIAAFAHIAFSQDNKYFAEAMDSTNVIRELSTGKIIKVLSLGLTKHQFIWQLGFSGLDQPLVVFDYNDVTQSFEIRKLDLKKPQAYPTLFKITLVDHGGPIIVNAQGFIVGDTHNSTIDPAKSISFCDAYTFNPAGTALTVSGCKDAKYTTLSIP